MRRSSFIGAALFGLLVGGLLAPGSSLAADGVAEPPRVVASILPVAAIAAAIMDGVAEPVLLLEPGASPHAYSLRPSEAGALADADLVLWIGEGLETFLQAPLEALAGDARIVELAGLPGLSLLPYRDGPLSGEGGSDHDEAHAEHGESDLDFHLWLSPANGRVMAAAIARTLEELDPAQSHAYAANLARFTKSLELAEAEIDTILAPVRGRPFLVFHDAYQYFEAHFDIAAEAAVHVSPAVQPGAARIAQMQALIQEHDAVCVFAEPQFEPRLLATVTENVEARSGVLDPLGGHLTLGPDTYPRLLVDLAQSLAACLEG